MVKGCAGNANNEISLKKERDGGWVGGGYKCLITD